MKIFKKNSNIEETWFSPRRFKEDDGYRIYFYLWQSYNPYIKLIHRKAGPAIIRDNVNFTWYEKHKLCRYTGPSYIGKTKSKYWSVSNKDFSEEKYWNC